MDVVHRVIRAGIHHEVEAVAQTDARVGHVVPCHLDATWPYPERPVTVVSNKVEDEGDVTVGRRAEPDRIDGAQIDVGISARVSPKGNSAFPLCSNDVPMSVPKTPYRRRATAHR